jgi:pimeloyl-ACP methyl ester carboxylesterase
MKSIECALKFRAEKVARLAEDLDDLVAETGKKASLIGWSLGGIYAHELASEHPELVRRVVTLGTPFGDPRGTALWPVMARRNGLNPGGDVAHLGEWLKSTPPKVPTTVIHSSRDGFVTPEIARLEGPLARHIHVNSSHIGLPANPRVFWHIANTLAHAQPGSAARS